MRKKIILLFILLLCICTSVFAQCKRWIESSSNSAGMGAWSVTTDDSNNVYSTGSFGDTISFGNDTLVNPGYSYYVNKFDSSGVIKWAIQFKSTDVMYYPPVIYQSSGSLYIAGTYRDTLIVNTKTGSKLTSPGPVNYFLLKTDLNGNLIWAHSYTGNSTSENYLFGITVNALNQVYFTGSFADSVDFGAYTLTTPDSLSPEAFLTKTDSSGNVLWAIQSANTGFLNSGWGVATDKNENVLITGRCSKNISFGSKTFNTNNSINYEGNPFAAKFDSSGICQWIIGGQGPLHFFIPLYIITTDPLGNVYFAGVMDSTITYNGVTLNPVNGAFYYAKYTSAGNLVWIKQTGNSNTFDQAPSSLVIDASNNLWMSGWLYGPANFGSYLLTDTAMFIVEFDTSGTILNAIGSTGTGPGYTSALDNNGSLYVGGTSYTPTVSFNGSSATGGSRGGDVILKYCTPPTGIPQLSSNPNSLSIYPNPTNGEVTIISSKNIQAIKVTNLIGQTTLEKTVSSLSPYPKQTIDLSSLSAGMYFVTVTVDNETTTSKVIVSK